MSEQCEEGASMSRGMSEQSGERPSVSAEIPGLEQNVTGKRKLIAKSMEDKYAALTELENGSSKSDVAKKFNIPQTTIYNWIKNADKIKEAYHQSGYSPARKRARVAKLDDVEEALLAWYKTVTNENVPLSGPRLRAKAEEFATRLGHSEFKCSVGWLGRFKERHGIVFEKTRCKRKAVENDKENANVWQKLLESLLNEYEEKDIFNADETGIFFKMFPEKSLALKGVDCHGGQRSKERLTVLVAANMMGTEKLPLLVIGKAVKPRCFKNVKSLPTFYEPNIKAWMTSEIFSDWLVKLDLKMQWKKRKIAMVIDNCHAHPNVENLKCIKLIFLPTNTTSKTQPMNQGVIQNLKIHYRKQFLVRHLQSTDKKEELHISILDAMHFLRQSWENIKPDTINKCFIHAAFQLTTPVLDDDGDPDTNLPLSTLAASNVTLEDYASVDNNLMTSCKANDEDIVQDVIASRSQQPNDDDDDDNNEDEDHEDGDEEAPRPAPTIDEANDAMDIIRRFVMSQSDGATVMVGYSMIANYVYEKVLQRCVKAEKE